MAPSAFQLDWRVTTILMRSGKGFFGSESQVLRPITTGLPTVNCLKRLRSSLMRQGIAPFVPITPLSAIARIKVIIGSDDSSACRPVNGTYGTRLCLCVGNAKDGFDAQIS